MSTKKKGDILETMIYVLEQSLTDNPNTKIHSKYRLKDRDGVEREIDIFVETQVNGKSLKYAFECKNYKAGVQLCHIADFQSKIADLGIKGYFVTTSNYQSGAIEKAKAFNIDLLQLKKRELNPHSIEGLLLFQKRFKVHEIKVFGKHVPSNLDINEIITTCDKCKAGITRAVEEDILPFVQSNLDEGIEAIYPDFSNINKIRDTIGESKAETLGLYVMMEPSSLTHKGVEIPYEAIMLQLKVWHEFYEHKAKNVNSFSYMKHNENGLLATFSVSEFVLGDSQLAICLTKLEGGRNKLSIGVPSEVESFITRDSVCIGSINELGLTKSHVQDNDEGLSNDKSIGSSKND